MFSVEHQTLVFAHLGVKKNNTYEYDPETDKWTEKKNMPTARAGVTATVYNDKIYVIGGYLDVGTKLQRTSKVEIYDPKLDTWTTAPNMPTARSWAAASTVGNKIYVMGGAKNGNDSGTISTALPTIECFDIEKNSWSTLKDMPFSANITSQSIGDKIYVLGGFNYSSTYGTIYEYDPANETWTLKKETSLRTAMGTAIINGKIYLLGGSSNGPNGIMDTVEVYDPIDNSLNSFKNLTFSRVQNVAASVGNDLYVIGGTDGSTNGALKTVEMIKIANDENPEPEQPTTGNRAILVITMNTGFEKEFDLSMQEVNDFITWYENKQAGTGTASYAIDKHDNNRGPFSARKDYVIFDKILTFEVNEYNSVTNE
ncbi:Kelch repeat-containing protein [Paenibacillus oralis]|nr:kelch-like protein [Paenibacillus oralis]